MCDRRLSGIGPAPDRAQVAALAQIPVHKPRTRAGSSLAGLRITAAIRNVNMALFLAPILVLFLQPQAALQEALTFHVSFDSGFDADLAGGDPQLYHAPGWQDRNRAAPQVPDAEGVHATAGRHGSAIAFSRYTEGMVFYRAADNLVYRDEDWSGTMSFWLKLDPDEDLEPGAWCDPIQITSRSWDDGALFVDFTRQVPRRFRLAAFADRGVWNPAGQDWQKMPEGAMPMITVEDAPFDAARWTHVALAWSRFNGAPGAAVLKGYLDGQPAGVLRDRPQVISWSAEEVLVQIGLQMVGAIDDLAFFDRELSAEEVDALFRLAGGVGALYQQ